MNHEAIYALNSSIVTIDGNTAYDKDGNIIEYDKDAAQAKLVELEAAEIAAQEAQATAKQSALAKLSALGLTQDEIKALVG
jgi:hypothetical protein